MSWFGANLNDSLNSIKGQIVSLKDVLIDDDKVEEQGSATLDTGTAGYLSQIEKLQHDKAELESRLTATVLESRRKITNLEDKLSSVENKYKNLKENSADWEWQEQLSKIEQKDGSSKEKNVVIPHVSTYEQDAIVAKLQSELKSLLDKFEEANHEKNRLLLDVQELDSQHQEALEILYAKKTQLEADVLEGNEKLRKSDEELMQLKSRSNLIEGEERFEEAESSLLSENQKLSTELEILRNKFSKLPVSSAELGSDSDISRLEMQLKDSNLIIEQLANEKIRIADENSKIKSFVEKEIRKHKAEMESIIVENKKLQERNEEEYNKLVTSIKDKLDDSELKNLKYEAVMEEQARQNEVLSLKLRHENNRCKQISEELFELKTHGNNFNENLNAQSAMDCLDQLMNKCNLTTIEELPTAIGEKDSEIALLRCERDKLQEELDSTSQDLKDTQEVVELLENDKLNLEGECEGLRDQLEELQYGKREEPEGSLSRALTTIEEEDAEPIEEARNSTIVKPESDESSVKKDRISKLKSEIVNLKSEIVKLNSESNIKIIAQDTVHPSQADNQSNHIDEQLVKIDKLRAQVIYKDDQIDDLKNTVLTIGQLVGIEEYNKRETYFCIKRELENLNNKISEQNKTHVSDDSKNILIQFDEVVQQNSTLQQNLTDASDEKLRIGNKITELDGIIKNYIVQKDDSDEEYEKLKKLLADEKIKNVEYSREKNLSAELQLKITQQIESYESLFSKYQSIEDEDIVLKDEIVLLVKSRNECVDDKNKMILNYEISLSSINEELFQKNNTISELKSEIDSLKESISQSDLNYQLISSYEKKISNLETTIDQLKFEIASLNNNNSKLTLELNTLQEEVQLITDKNEKEMNKCFDHLERVKISEKKLMLENSNMSETVSYKNEELLKLQAESVNFTRQLTEVKQETSQQHEERDSKIALLMKQLQEETEKFNESQETLFKIESEVTKLQASLQNITTHNEQLVAANSAFNSQYEMVSKEMLSAQEKEKHLVAECERLKRHLVSIEESYTSEAVQAEQRESALKQTIAKLHDKMASHSNLYSSTNQKNADRVETLQESLKNAIIGRDEALQKLQCSEESSIENQEAMHSLNEVLLEFQKSYKKDVKEATEKDRRELEGERNKTFELQQDVNSLRRNIETLEDSTSSSQQLHDDIQTKQSTILALQSQVNAMQQVVRYSQDQVLQLQSSSEVKVDKNLVRNLFVGYFASPINKQLEVLHIIAEILDFSPDERVRTGLDINRQSWLTSVANFLAPPPSNIRVTSKVDVLDHSSLSQAFIRFLEDESNVHPRAKLPAIEMAEEANQKALKKSQSKCSKPLIEIATSNQTFSPLIDTPLSTIPPIVLQTVNSRETAENRTNISEQKYLKNLLSEDKTNPEENS